MTTRNLTTKFESLRSSLHRHSYAPSLSSKGSLLDKSMDSADIELGESLTRSFTPQLPPEWVDIVDDINANIVEVKKLLASLSLLHSKRLKVSFGDDVIASQEAEIEIQTQAISHLLRKSENGVKSIALVGNNNHLPPQEKTIRLNVMRSLATDLSAVSKQFRQGQKEFLRNLREQEQISSSFGFNEDNDSKSSLTFDDALDKGLTTEQLHQMEEIEAKANEREKEIIKIAQSVNDLATLFKELNVLVIEQGTILDRIDYNIEQTLVKVQVGNKELTEADRYSKKAYTLKCILALIVLIIILMSVLIWKHS